MNWVDPTPWRPTRAPTLLSRGRARLEPGRVATAGLCLVAVAYVGIRGGGYDPVLRGELGVAVWWALGLVAAVGLRGVRRPSRGGWVALAALATFAAWTALGMIWSADIERTFAETSRVVVYLGILGVAIACVHRERAADVANGIAAGVVVVALVGLVSRLHPQWFPTGDQTAVLVPGSRSRLSFPLNYWNALGALVMLGAPLVLNAAHRARTQFASAVAAAMLPVLALTVVLTISRTATAGTAVTLAIYLALSRERLMQLATLAAAAAGTAILTVALVDRHSLEQGLIDGNARHQGTELLVLTIVVCVSVGLTQVGLRAAWSRGLIPRLRRPARAGVRRIAVASLAVVLTLAVAFDLPGRVQTAWHSFKQPVVSGDLGTARLSSLSSHGRYELWKESLNAFASSPVHGIGGGTWELWWLRHGAAQNGYTQYAHSLFFQTLAEVGIVGLAALLAFLSAVLAGALTTLRRERDHDQGLHAAFLAVCVGFLIAVAFDWNWQVTVLPAIFLLVAGTVLSPAVGSRATRALSTWPRRLAIAAVAALCLVAIGIPLATTIDVRDSQAATNAGRPADALGDAHTAAQLEPYAVTPLLQRALVLERYGRLDGAETAARDAARNGPGDWQGPLILARIQAKRGEVTAALASFRHARQLNPTLSQYLR